MKILVLGANGMAGHVIAIYMREMGYNVTAFTRRPFKYCKNIIGDAFDSDKIESEIILGGYDAVVNCIGVLNEYAEKNKMEAVYLNAYFPHFLSKITEKLNTKLIHISTDCVFSGNTGPYYENSFKDGKSFYDRSKALGEIIDSKNLTFRNSIIGPDMNVQGIGLFNWFMSKKEKIKGFTHAIWTGVTTLVLAKAIEQSFKEDLKGIYNLVNNESISKYKLLMLFNKYFRDGKIEIEESCDLVLDKSLRTSREDFSFKVPSYEYMISEMKEWINQHKELYPNYRLK